MKHDINLTHKEFCSFIRNILELCRESGNKRLAVKYAHICLSHVACDVVCGDEKKKLCYKEYEELAYLAKELLSI